MAKTIDRKLLEQYVAGELTPAMKKRVEAELGASTNLRQLLEEIRGEAEIVKAVKDSQAIRLSDQEENRITHNAIGGLRTTLESTEKNDIDS